MMLKIFFYVFLIYSSQSAYCTQNDNAVSKSTAPQNNEIVFKTPEIISIIGILISSLALIVSINASRHASKSDLINLHNVWLEIRDIDPEEPITPDVIIGIKALQYTSETWQENIIKKKIIYEYAGNDFKQLYESLNRCIVVVPRMGRTGNSMLTESIKKTYIEILTSKYKDNNNG